MGKVEVHADRVAACPADLVMGPVLNIRGNTEIMSSRRRKTPIVGHTTCCSEREDKKLWD